MARRKGRHADDGRLNVHPRHLRLYPDLRLEGHDGGGL